MHKASEKPQKEYNKAENTSVDEALAYLAKVLVQAYFEQKHYVQTNKQPAKQ